MDTSRINRLIKKAQEGDKRAFEKLIRTKGKNISYIALSILKNQHDAEDAAQEAIVSMYRHIGSLQNPEAFEAWMYRIVFHACIRIQNKGKKQETTDIDEIVGMDIKEARIDLLPQESSEKAETSRFLLNKIKDLPDNYRNCLYLFYYEDMSYDQIADALGSSVKDVSNWLERGRKKLKAEIGYDEIKEKGHAALDGPLMASAFALDIKQTVHDNKLVEDALRLLFAESAALPLGSFLSTAAGKLALAGAAIVAIGLGGLLLNQFLPTGGEPAPHSETVGTPTKAESFSPTETIDEAQERAIREAESAGSGDSDTAVPEQGGSGTGTGTGTGATNGTGNGMASATDSESSEEFIIENEVLYGTVDPKDPTNPNAEKSPTNPSNEVKTKAATDGKEASYNGSALPLGKTGDTVWQIVLICGMGALVSAVALFVVQRAKRKA